jgi:hypothetical protein
MRLYIFQLSRNKLVFCYKQFAKVYCPLSLRGRNMTVLSELKVPFSNNLPAVFLPSDERRRKNSEDFATIFHKVGHSVMICCELFSQIVWTKESRLEKEWNDLADHGKCVQLSHRESCLYARSSHIFCVSLDRKNKLLLLG